MSQQLPFIRWGILGTGRISTLFVNDLIVAQNDASSPVKHVIKAIGTSSLSNGRAFIEANNLSSHSPDIYSPYGGLCTDKGVDIVYVGLPHSLHKEGCLAAISAKKHVLCEKPMAINSKEVEEMIAAAKNNGVFLMEGIWTRFLPATVALHKLVHDKKVIGQVTRMFFDFSCQINMEALPVTSRMRNMNLGAGALLDLGIYPLVFSNMILDGEIGDMALRPNIASSLTVIDGIDHSIAIIVNYPSKGALGILSVSFQANTAESFCRIEGTEGIITLNGSMAAKPERINIKKYNQELEEVQIFDHEGTGLYFEANAVALDVLAGRTENTMIPLAETKRLSEMMDDIRKSGGIVYSQDL